jgi:hypothetical protein
MARFLVTVTVADLDQGINAEEAVFQITDDRRLAPSVSPELSPEDWQAAALRLVEMLQLEPPLPEAVIYYQGKVYRPWKK